MSNCVHDTGGYCEVFSDKEVRQPCFETPICEDYKEIVRCKDCKYWMKDYVTEDDLKYYYGNKDMCIRSGEYKEIPMSANDFCSRGEKK